MAQAPHPARSAPRQRAPSSKTYVASNEACTPPRRCQLNATDTLNCPLSSRLNNFRNLAGC
eukprot:4553130-Pleurochrysis_carterae.AAC.1